MLSILKYTSPILLLLVFASCTQKQLSLEEYMNIPVNVELQEVESPAGDFALSIPRNWKWAVSPPSDPNFISTFNAWSPTDKDGFIDFIIIQEVKQLGTKDDFEAEYTHLLNTGKNQQTEMTVHDYGKTDIFKSNAYYIHSKSDSGTYGETEMILFILKSQKAAQYYHITVGASQTKDLKENMAVVLKSVKAFLLTK